MEKLWKEQQKLYGSSISLFIDNIYDIVPAVKPQIAMYEQFG